MFDNLWFYGNNLRATREATAYLFKNFYNLGLQKPKKWKFLYYLYSVILNLSVCALLPISFTLSYILEYSKMSAVQLLSSLQVAINVWGLPAKFTTVLSSMKSLRRALDVMDILDARCTRPDEYEKIRYCAMIGNRLTIFYITFYIIYSASSLITSVSMGQPPYSLFIPVIEWRNSRTEFVVQAFIEFSLINFICLHQAGADVYAVIYIYALRTHMQILVERVKRLGRDIEISKDENFEQLIQCVKDHQNVLRLLEIISPVISITIFVQFTITAAILCTTLINILIFADTSAQIASVIYFMAVMVQTYPCCYQATCLLYDSEQLSLAILHCDWIDKDIRFRKLMIFFMMRSQTPITLTALKLFPITLNTSMGIAKFSFSLYTLIKKMDFGQNIK